MPFEIEKEKVDPERWWALKLTDAEFPAQFKLKFPKCDNLPTREGYLKSKHIRRPDEPPPTAQAVETEYDKVSREDVDRMVQDAVAKALAQVGVGEKPAQAKEPEKVQEEKRSNNPPHTNKNFQCVCGRVVTSLVGYKAHQRGCAEHQAKAAELEIAGV